MKSILQKYDKASSKKYLLNTIAKEIKEGVDLSDEESDEFIEY